MSLISCALLKAARYGLGSTFMTRSQPGALLTIGAAARRTGVSPATLRAWERRYGVPSPIRTPSGYRLYGDDALEAVEELRKQHSAGVKPRQAALLVTHGRTNAAGDAMAVDAWTRVEPWRRRLTAACLRFDTAAADEVIAHVSQAIGALNALRHVIIPVVAAVGDARHRGLITVSREHFASQLAQRVAWSFRPVASPVRRAPVLTACAPGERHELGLLLFVAELRSRGHRVVHLGCDVPVGAFLAALDSLQARVAVVGATMPAHVVPWVARRTDVKRRARRGVHFVWGGAGASGAGTALPGLVTDSSADALQAVSEWLQSHRLNVPPRTATGA